MTFRPSKYPLSFRPSRNARTLTSQFAGVGENGRAVPVNVLVEVDPGRSLGRSRRARSRRCRWSDFSNPHQPTLNADRLTVKAMALDERSGPVPILRVPKLKLGSLRVMKLVQRS
jgi:hypothetical protein